ncbi:uncharacterized protein LOC129770386 [Toxorhynchites rutilus septentrionalis]|uniref:uncharacterized protein LOC129770386 n=1 Tax=Toxorhynchites rutilus septentrionalis TaxID=329112 RepID=UPI002478B36D|nr:uncharacterized protein LOC129770386 [Toxorhynchites rutilus septentrionalis]
MASLQLIVAVVAVLSYTVTVNADITELKQTCAKLLRVPAEDLERYLRSEYEEKHEDHCFIRCVSILNGMYDDDKGVQFGKLHGAFGEGLTEEEYTEQAKTCVLSEEEAAKEDCHCRKASREMSCILKQYLDRKKTQQE